MQASSSTEQARVTHLLKRNAPPVLADKKLPSTKLQSRNNEKVGDAKNSLPTSGQNIMGVKKVDNPSRNSASCSTIVTGVEAQELLVPREVLLSHAEHVLPPPAAAVSSSSETNSPANTQEELQAFNQECEAMEQSRTMMPPPPLRTSPRNLCLMT
jgi:hypothetical protein